MKNALLILNILLLILVGYLYFVQFGNTKPAKTSETKTEVADTLNEKVNIAYIVLDSLKNNYTYYKKIKVDFEKKQASAKNEIASLQKKFQTRAMQLQQKAQNMNQQEQENAMQEMNKMQNDFQQRNQNIENELMDFSTKFNDEFLLRIQNFLKTYNKDGKYSYIFSYEPGFMFYKDSTLDITPDVIIGLNGLYKEDKK